MEALFNQIRRECRLLPLIRCRIDALRAETAVAATGKPGDAHQITGGSLQEQATPGVEPGCRGKSWPE